MQPTVPGATFCCIIGSSVAAERSRLHQQCPKLVLAWLMYQPFQIPSMDLLGLDHNSSMEEIIIYVHTGKVLHTMHLLFRFVPKK